MTDEIKPDKDHDTWPEAIELVAVLGFIAFLFWLFLK